MNLFDEKYLQYVKGDFTWQECIYKSCEQLLNDGIISKKWIEKVIENTIKWGAYYIITNDLAFPHCDSFEEVKSTKVGFSIFEKPVIFDKKSVRFVLVLATIDGNSHINLLKDVVMKWNDIEFLNQLNQIEDLEQLKDLVLK